MERENTLKEVFDQIMSNRKREHSSPIITPENTAVLSEIKLHPFYAGTINTMVAKMKDGDTEINIPAAEDMKMIEKEFNAYMDIVDPENNYLQQRKEISVLIKNALTEHIAESLKSGKYNYVAKLLEEKGIKIENISQLTQEDKSKIEAEAQGIREKRGQIKSLLDNTSEDQKYSRETMVARVKDYLLVFPDHIGELNAENFLTTIENSIATNGAERTASEDIYNLPIELVKDIEKMMEQEDMPSAGIKL